MIPKKGFIILLCAGLISTLPATVFAKSSVATSAQSLPIRSVTPSNLSDEVRPDSPIVIQLDASSPNFARFREQFIKGAFTALVNGLSMTATYNPATYSIAIQHPALTRYTNYTVQLLLKAADSTDGSADNAEESFSFETGSAIGEATHASAELETPRTPVGTVANLRIIATDDYGDTATNATVSLSGSGPGNAVNPSQFTAPVTTPITNGETEIHLQDTTAETVNLSYVISDNTYANKSDVHTGKLTETFVPGPTANIQMTGPETFVAGDSGSTYRAVLADAYGNPVADGTDLAVTSVNGSITNQTGVVNGSFSFDYKPSMRSGNDTITLTAADSGYTSKTVIHVRPLPPVINNPQNIDDANVSSFTVSGLGAPRNTVRIALSDGEHHTGIATGIVGYDGRYVVNVDASSLKDGPITVQATQVDVDGNVSDPTYATTQKDMYIPTGVTVTGTTLSWNPVAGAAGYVVSVYDEAGHGNGTRTTSTSVNILDIPSIEAGIYKVDVRSYGVPSSPFGQSLSSPTVIMNVAGLSAPTNVQANGTIVSWDAVPNATSYSIWVHDSNGNVAFATTTQGMSVDLSHRGLPTGTYTVEINARDATEHYASSPWVSASVYIHSDGQLDIPSNVTVSGVKVSWDPVSGATGYEIKIYNSDKTGYESYNTNQNSTTLFQPTGNYFVSVTATAAPETNIANSPETQLVPVSVVALDSPVLTTSGSVVSWSPVTNATRYNATVFDSTGNYVKSIGSTFATSLDLSQQGLPTGDYILHISAWDDTLTYAPSQDGVSEVIHTVSSGALATPVNLTINGTILSWDAVPNATGYRVMENEDTQGFGIYTTSASVDLAQPWVPDGTYNITVIALGAGTDYSDSSPSNSIKFTLSS